MNAIHYTARKIKLAVTCLNLEVNRYNYDVVQFYPWLNFYFLLFKLSFIHYQTPKRKKIKIKPNIKLNHNIHNFSG